MSFQGNIPTTSEIRRRFITYFSSKNHAEIASSSVIPHDDPTLLFTNAGMNQFKDVFLGEASREYTRAVTSQKCIRAGGKHNDLENVGHTSRHLTFFEMLGNFSFGDYFKEQSIRFAWEVSTEVFQFPPEKIFPTVFTTDNEAFEIWTKYVPASRITKLGEKDNFWSMGDTGPCGPCSELYYDKGVAYGDALSPLYDVKGERYLEFWNLVFMQYNQDETGRVLLPKPSIDTGAGLERVMSLITGVDTLFETDILRELIGAVEKLSYRKYDPQSVFSSAFRVIADHIRSITFAIADGAQPSNTDRGYVIRKILRRAVRYGRQLGFEKPFLCELVSSLVAIMGDHYPELKTSSSRASEIIAIEEENFLKTVQRGGSLLLDVLNRAQKDQVKILSGDDAFRLKDTYGLPLEEILLLAHDSHLSVDMNRYKELEEEARLRSKAAHKASKMVSSASLYESILNREGKTEFFYHPECVTSIVAILHNGVEVTRLNEGESGEVFLKTTPFYAEMGGQVGDTGMLITEKMEALVLDTITPYKGIFSHNVVVTKGELHTSDVVICHLDMKRRGAIEKNHTATHLLHWALSEVLGPHIRQSGSFVDERSLRFDFAHHKAVTQEELLQVEKRVNEEIQMNHAVSISHASYEEVQKNKEIKQFFGDKYGSTVRIVSVGSSYELCGGTHVEASGKIGLFRIIKEGSIAAGIRRIEAVSGLEAVSYTHRQESTLSQVASILQASDQNIIEKMRLLLQEKQVLEKQVERLEERELSREIEKLVSIDLAQDPLTTLVYGELHCTSSQLKDAAEKIVQKYSGRDVCVIVGIAENDKAHLLVRMPKNSVYPILDASHLLKRGLVIIDGKGGGKKEMAQGAGKNPSKLLEAISVMVNFIEL